MAGKDNKELNDVLIIGAVSFVGYFGVVRPLLRTLGINPEDTATVDQLQNNTPAQGNPFDILFGVSNITNGNIADHFNAYKADMDANWQNYQNQYNAAPDVDPLSTTIPEVYYAEQIKNALRWYWPNDQTVIAIFNELTSQFQVSAIARYLSDAYQIDLLSYLRTGQKVLPVTFDGGLTDTELATLINHIKTLPVWPPSWGS